MPIARSNPLLTPPAKRVQRKGSDATIKSKPSVESLDSCDKGALSRLGTIDQMGTPGSAVEPSPRPKKLKFSPTSEETALQLVDPKTPTPDQESDSSKPSTRVRQYLKDQKKKKAQAKAKAKAKIRRGKVFIESPKSKTMKKPAAAKAAPAPAASGASAVKSSQTALSLRGTQKKDNQTPTEQAQPEAKETGEDQDPGVDKLAHKLYMRYWRSVNESHFVGTMLISQSYNLACQTKS